ncbi:MAG: SGNH/GDSL hydrolase family protein, partial [Chloroflexota bacterium]|nr:SGNH/GDSL hydrolase family protein [Chloroflexota bacterium]
REQLPTALGLRPQLVTVWLAVNDLNANVTATDYAVALRSVVEPLVSRTVARVFVGNVPDLRSVPAYAGTDQAALLARITAYNAAITALAAAFPGRVTVVDLFTGSAALVSTITVSADGFHPSDAGYALIADRFVKAIADAGIALR